MKNISKTIASVGFSLLTVWAFGQYSLKTSFQNEFHPNPLGYTALPKHANSNPNNRTESNPTKLLMAYWNSDAAIQQNGGQFTDYEEYMNAYYTTADTENSAHVRNYLTLNSMTVAYDSIIDQNGVGYGLFGNQVTLDTLVLVAAWHNTTLHNDTLVISIIPVCGKGSTHGPIGYPDYLGTAYKTFKVVLQGTPANRGSATVGFKLPGNTMDSIYTIAIPVSGGPLAIPKSAVNGHWFAVETTFLDADKQDTFALVNFQDYTTCGASVNYTPATVPGFGYTQVGVGISNFKAGYSGAFISGVPHANSFALGFYYFNTTKQGGYGNGSPLSWPDVYFGLPAITSNGSSFSFELTLPCAGDTGTYMPQNFGIGVDLTANEFSPEGVNEVTTDNSFSIDQNFPNPFNKNTQITYNLTKSSDVVFSVYDLTGRELVNNTYSTVAPGKHSITLEANQFTAGIYFYTFNVAGTQVTKKMIITQ